MANYYTKLSMAFTAKSQEAYDWFMKCAEITQDVTYKKMVGDDITDEEALLQLEPFYGKHGKSLLGWEQAPSVSVQSSEDAESPLSIWISDEDGCPCLGALNELLQAYLRKWDPTGSIGYTWSDDCDKPRLDAYGGGWMLMSANGTRGSNARSDLEKAQKRFEKERAKPKKFAKAAIKALNDDRSAPPSIRVKWAGDGDPF